MYSNPRTYVCTHAATDLPQPTHAVYNRSDPIHADCCMLTCLLQLPTCNHTGKEVWGFRWTTDQCIHNGLVPTTIYRVLFKGWYFRGCWKFGLFIVKICGSCQKDVKLTVILTFAWNFFVNLFPATKPRISYPSRSTCHKVSLHHPKHSLHFSWEKNQAEMNRC